MSSESLSQTSSSSATTRCISTDSTEDSLDSLIRGGSKEACEPCPPCDPCDPCPVTCENAEKPRNIFCNRISRYTWGVLLVVVAIGGFIFTPLDFMLWEKLNMRPGFPPYEWWADPPDEVKLRVHVFNVTNHERFLNGLDRKLDVRELPEVVYLEKLQHSNIKFNENSTMTYTAKRTLIYLPKDNTVDLNQTIVVPNLAVLGIASYLHSAPYFVRTAFRFLVNSYGSEFFVKKTVYEYLWEYREAVLDTSRSLAPGLVPVSNMGMLARIYADFTDEMTVFIGPQWGHRNFFEITLFRGEPQLPGYDPEQCPDRIAGSTEGVMYRQRITKQDVLLYWRKTVCKLMPLYFDQELTVDSVPVYRFNLSESVFERVKNGTDCYDTIPSLPDGLSDGAKCYYDFPMVISYPHFYTGQPARDTYVTGLQPDRDKHNSYVVVEPLTGTPFHSVARMQSNLLINDLSGFSAEYDRFSNLVIPLFWAEYNQEGLPSHIRKTIHFMTVILPPLSTVGLTLTLLVGCFLLSMQILNIKNDSLILPFKSKKVNNLAKSKLFVYETEKFLKSPS